MGALPACTSKERGGVHLIGEHPWSLTTGLHGPHTADLSPDGDALLVADTCNHRLVIYDLPGASVAWDSRTRCPGLSLPHPNFAIFTGEGVYGRVLVSSLTGHFVAEIDPLRCAVTWRLDEGLRFPHAALPVGATDRILVVDSGGPLNENGRVIEVERDGHIVWSYPPEDCRGCRGTSWTRNAELACDDGPECRSGTVWITDRDETIRVHRDLDAWADGESVRPDRHLLHGEGYAYSAAHLAAWEGDDNGGAGWLLVSHHGLRRDEGWVRIVAADGADSSTPIWQLDYAP
ncbi:MAG: hypothetical protein ACI8S6_001500 [Myxococcota bacterium]|jgi:hypothetical protein